MDEEEPAARGRRNVDHIHINHLSVADMTIDKLITSLADNFPPRFSADCPEHVNEEGQTILDMEFSDSSTGSGSGSGSKYLRRAIRSYRPPRTPRIGLDPDDDPEGIFDIHALCEADPYRFDFSEPHDEDDEDNPRNGTPEPKIYIVLIEGRGTGFRGSATQLRDM